MAESALWAESERHRQTEAKVAAAETELVSLKQEVAGLETQKADILKQMGVVMESTSPQVDLDVYPLRTQIVLQHRKISTLERSMKVAQDRAKKERDAKINLKAQVARRDAKIDRIRRHHEEALANPSESDPLVIDEGGGDSEAEKTRVVRERLVKKLNPTGEYGDRCARMCQRLMEQGLSLKSTGPMVETVLDLALDVQMKGVGITLDSKTVKLLALGMSELDAAELRAVILAAPFLLVAADESLRNGNKTFPIFVFFWHEETDSPWWGLFRVCSMKDKTAETQASLFYDTIVNDLKYPPDRVLFVLSDNTASVSAEVGGCVALLQRKEVRTQLEKPNSEGRGGRPQR